LRVLRYPTAKEAEGNEISAEEWQALLLGGEALAFPAEIPARPGAALWVLRHNYGADRELAERSLLQKDPQAQKIIGEDGAWAFVVAEPEVAGLRGEWADASFNAAWEAAKWREWNEAQALAERAFALDRTLQVDHVALLALIYDQVRDKTRSEALLEMARRSRGDVFYRGAREKMKELVQDLAAAPAAQTKGQKPRFDPYFFRLQRREYLEKQLRSLRNSGEAEDRRRCAASS
jgi:hypothetical protein